MIRETKDKLEFRGNPYHPEGSYNLCKKLFNSLAEKGIEYTDDTIFSIHTTSDNNLVYIQVAKKVICTIEKEERFLIVKLPFYAWEDSSAAYRKIEKYLKYLASHEVDEHFKVGGKHYVNPHPLRPTSRFYNSGTVIRFKR